MNKKKENNFKVARYIHMGLSMGVSFALWGFLGYFLGTKVDEWIRTEPWFMIAGLLLGITFAFMGFIREIIILTQPENKDKKDKDKKS